MDNLSRWNRFGEHRHVFHTNNHDVDPDSGDSTEFDTVEALEKFSAWMEYVHEAVKESDLDYRDLRDRYNIDIWNHKDIYRLFKNRKKLPKFFELLAAYEKKIDYRDWLEDSNIVDTLRWETELD